jgi:hypothetical protein
VDECEPLVLGRMNTAAAEKYAEMGDTVAGLGRAVQVDPMKTCVETTRN